MSPSLLIFARILLLLIAAHIICDTALQDARMSASKRRNGGEAPWYIALAGHSIIHSAAVLLITGSLALAVVEFVAHWLIDYWKCEGRIDFKQDQFLHVMCKLAYAVVVLAGVL